MLVQEQPLLQLESSQQQVGAKVIFTSNNKTTSKENNNIIHINFIYLHPYIFIKFKPLFKSEGLFENVI